MVFQSLSKVLKAMASLLILLVIRLAGKMCGAYGRLLRNCFGKLSREEAGKAFHKVTATRKNFYYKAK